MADPLGVGALVLTEDNYFVAFQRSDVVGEFSGYVDIPGGHPEPSEVGIAIDFLILMLLLMDQATSSKACSIRS